MSQIRTLKLNLLADVTKFGAGMVEARGDMNKLSTAAERSGKRVAAAFVAMGAAAGYAAYRIGKESVDAAIQDEASQKVLAQTLENVTGATYGQIAATEKWITKQQFASGFTDSQLRPALSNLVRVTGDVTEAQKLTNLAMDISRGTGKDLETVSLALAKAHEGNLGALTRLGVPLGDNIIKTGDFTAATAKLTDLFGGQAASYAETYQGKLAIVNERLAELKEGIGAKLIDKFAGLLAVVNDVAAGFAGENPNQGLSGQVQKFNRSMGIDPKTGGYKVGEAVYDVSVAFKELWAAISDPKAGESLSTLESLAKSLNTVAGAINSISDAVQRYQQWKNESIVGQLLNWQFLREPSLVPQRAMGGSVSAGQAYTVGEFGRETFIPNTSGRIVPNGGGSGNTFILNGIIDAESARRSIEKLLQNSARRTGAINLVGATL